jgi:hypothetical protein
MNIQNKIIKETKKFRVEPNYPCYPPYHEGDYIEKYFYNYFIKNKIKTNRIYIPIFWTNCYNNNWYSKKPMPDIQSYLNSLDPDLKYFTVCQHERAPQEILPKNTLVFSASGKIYEHNPSNNYIPIPLICSKIKNPDLKKKKDIFCSFVGADTHRVRRKLQEQIKNNKDFHFDMSNWIINIPKHKEEKFKDITEKSIFTLCPRGNGPTSFRLYETMQLGSIPVYVYDTLWIPYSKQLDWNNLCIFIHENEIPHIEEILKNISKEKINEIKSYTKKIYNEWFSLEGMSSKIIEHLKNEKTRLLTFYSDSHDILFKNYFKPSVDNINEYDLVVEKFNQIGANGSYFEAGWRESMLEKLKFIVKTINECWQDYFVFSDIDVIFINKTKDFLINELGNKDVAFQRDVDDLCAGFFIMKANQHTLNFINTCIINYDKYPKFDDQGVMRRYHDILNYKLLPNNIFNISMINKGKVWNGEYYKFPKDISVFHANWTIGVKAKIDLFNMLIENLNTIIDFSFIKQKEKETVFYKFKNGDIFSGIIKYNKMISGNYIKKFNEISLINKDDKTINVNIYYNYFESENDIRNKELQYCLNRILSNKKINNIYLLCSNNYTKKLDKRIIKIDMFNHQPTYEDVFNIINFNTGDNDLNIILNSDCFIDEENVQLILNNIKHKQVYCLSRWDITCFEPFKTKHIDSAVSQDAWIFLGKAENFTFTDFSMGKPGCDNRIAYEFDLAKYTVLNPSQDVKVYHYHFSNHRTYGNTNLEKEKNRIPRPYKFIASSKIDFNNIVIEEKKAVIEKPIEKPISIDPPVPENKIQLFNITNTEDFYLLHHLGLTDHIICNGIVRYYANTYKRLHLFCKENNVDIVKYMFRDLHNLSMITIQSDSEINSKLINIPKENLLKIYLNNADVSGKKTFDVLFYERAKISLNHKWNNFYISRDSNMEKTIFTKLLKLKEGDEYVFAQGNLEKMKIKTNLRIINVDDYLNTNIFYFLYTIEKATEVHCENNLFYWLIDCMQLKKENLFLYSPKNNMIGTQKLNWTLVSNSK